jgi:hypothetical protein
VGFASDGTTSSPVMGPPRGSTSSGAVAGALAAIRPAVRKGGDGVREVRAFDVRGVLRLWLRGEGIPATERLAGVDRESTDGTSASRRPLTRDALRRPGDWARGRLR